MWGAKTQPRQKFRRAMADTIADMRRRHIATTAIATGRGLHSSTILLNGSTFYGILWAHEFPPVY